MGFNKPVVNMFFDKYKQLHQRFHFGPQNIYNIDETELTTVQGSIKVLATTGQKQVGQITSTERGTLTTMCRTINTLGNSIPPVLVFPWVHYKDFMIKGAPHGTLGAATPSGWMSTEVSWLLRHPGKQIPERPEQKTGLYPFDRYIFDDSEFLASSVTDIAPNETTATSLTSVITNTSVDAPSTSSSGRKRQNTQILTDTPIRNELTEIENAKIAKKRKQSVKRNLSKSTKEKKVDFSDTSSNSASVYELPEFGNSDNDMSTESEEAKTCEELKVNGFVLVRFATKKQVKYYVRQVKKILQDELIIFLRRKKHKFAYPAVEDVATVDKDDIVLVLLKPLNTGGTARINSHLKFPIDFVAYNVC
ncbi:hypothetical protein ILUMI_20103 [Ignelater luminosus]|uniref:Uncharacterized protein n=1 Tax=Ignelater luminosus TaxID=2038154 RepID=A0A8K0CEW1_IGNLU|nr:hypothetical protein ILUMI_20103 [Ignelater luminosus]